MTEFSTQLRASVIRRAGERCEYCRLPVVGQVAPFPIDHIIPRSKSGRTISSNLALACPHCNAHKWAFHRGLDPETSKEVALFHPRRQVWADHFAWSPDDPTQLVGLTACGRATIERLRMNDAPMRVTRRLLRELDLWGNA